MADGSGAPASHEADRVAASRAADSHDPQGAASLLELRDLVAGVQAQLDEIHSRLDHLEAWLVAHEAAHEQHRGGVARARSRAGRVRVTIVRWARRTP